MKGARNNLAPFFISAGLLFLGPVYAAVPVVEAGDYSSSSSSSSAGAGQDSLGILYSQLQQLQQEVRELRGQLEQQQNELDQLKQEQKDNYMDVDRRLSELATQKPAAAASIGTAPGATSGTSSFPLNEKDSYDQAYRLLDQGKRDEAVLALRKHILLYPQGELTPNAYYWLGQAYVLQDQLPDAEEQFTILIKQYPQHHKTMDAKFALGKVYFLQGKKAAAKKLIQEAAQSNSSTAPVAQKYLQDNF